MKKLFLIAAMMLLVTTSFAQSGRKIYEKYSDKEGVSAVYISPALFRMMDGDLKLEMNDEEVNLSPIIKTLNGFYLLEIENASLAKTVTDEVHEMVKDGKYELLMEMNDDGNLTHIYTTTKGSNVTSFVMLAAEKDELVFISIDGEMPQEEFEKLIRKAVE